MTAGSGDEAAGGPARHASVMLPDVLTALNPQAGGFYIDGTFGGGGYSRAILEIPGTSVLAIDRDPAAIATGQELVNQHRGRLQLVEGRFGDMFELVGEESRELVDGVTLDVGVSSPQLDTAERGFSFRSDGPLDMRMGQGGPSAEDAVNGLREEELTRIIRTFGEEKRARTVARAIARSRTRDRITRTGQLADIVESALGRGNAKIHPATRTFQAIRIFVNDELRELARGLSAAERLLRAGGRLAVVTFHSLEDRIVKRFLSERFGVVRGASRHRPEQTGVAAASFERVGPLMRRPSDTEVADNPRARSAKLRVAERTSAAAWPLSLGAIGVPDVGSLLAELG